MRGDEQGANQSWDLQPLCSHPALIFSCLLRVKSSPSPTSGTLAFPARSSSTGSFGSWSFGCLVFIVESWPGLGWKRPQNHLLPWAGPAAPHGMVNGGWTLLDPPAQLLMNFQTIFLHLCPAEPLQGQPFHGQSHSMVAAGRKCPHKANSP